MKAIVFGTCRIHDPAYLAHKLGHLDLVDAPLNLYMHNSAEISQYLRYLTGDLIIKSDFMDLIYLPEINKPIYSNNHPKFIPNQVSRLNAIQNVNDLKGVDLAIIEISTLRKYRLGSFFLQENCINKYLFENAGLRIREDEQLRELFETPSGKRRIAESSDEILSRLLNDCAAEYFDQKSIENDLLFIKSIFRNIIILNHFTSTQMPLHVIKSRQRLQGMIIAATRNLNIIWCDVSSIVKALPVSEQLMKEDDFNHYSNSVKQKIADRIGDLVSNL